MDDEPMSEQEKLSWYESSIKQQDEEIDKLRSEPRLPRVGDSPCNTTHYACDCVLKKISDLEKQLEEARKEIGRKR